MQLNEKKKSFSPLQRRSLQRFGGAMGFLVALTVFSRWMSESGQTTGALSYIIAVLPAIPVALIVVNAGRYIAQETDEFIKTIVVQALLWALGITLVVEVIIAGLTVHSRFIGQMLPLLSMDLFCVSALIALRIQLRRNR